MEGEKLTKPCDAIRVSVGQWGQFYGSPEEGRTFRLEFPTG